MVSNNISYKESINELDKINKKAKIIKERIENEIKKIEASQIKAFSEITSSFREKQFELYKEEKKLKNELVIKVKEIKNELEKSLKESDKILLYCEKIILANKNLEENNNELKKLYYISEMNIKGEELRKILNKPKRNLDIYFDSELDKVSYKDYYFGGIPTPKDIKYEIKGNCLLLTWNISKMSIEDSYNFFIIQIKTNNKELTYKTLFSNYLLTEYEINVEYEVKVRTSLYDDLGDWSEIKKFKINDYSGNKRNIFLSSGLFTLKDDENAKQKNNNIGNIFGAPKLTTNIFDIISLF